ncbi:MAG: Lrp/AsnC family transcriptional regulator [Deltaproteobacteria bacterium]|nr:Lrp/AsnC family transcriptional regulator [Deltaproteobacteria bacterium]
MMRNEDQGVLINNKTDLKLIAELQKDGSVSYSDLGARLGITPRTVAKRVEGLIESKLITIRAQPNPYKLNLSASAVVAIKADPTKIDHICDLLSGHFHVNLVQTIFGRLDILVIVYFSRWAQLHHFIRNELYTIDGITHAEFYFVEEVYKRYDRFFEKEPFPNGRVKLKETDWTLIEELAKDGCTKPVVLAEKLGIHVTTVYRRISALVKEGFIKISGVPNPSRLGYSANAFIILDVDPKEVKNTCSNLYSYPEVYFILTLSNRSGMIVCVHTKDTEMLYEFLKKKISSINGLINTETFIRAVVQKTYYGWLMETNANENAVIQF